MAVQIQLRRDLAAQWTSVNPTLAEGEIGIETDTGQVKIGTGLSAWTSLPYFGGAGGGSVTSTELSAVSAAAAQARSVISAQVVANSAQMTSADNAISNAVSIVSAAAANATSIANAVSNRLSTWTLDNLANVSAPSPTSSQVLKYNSAAGQWVASADATGGGGASVTSAEYQSLVDRVSANSGTGGAASVTSAELNVVSNAVSIVSVAVGVVSADLTSVKAVLSNLASDVSANSAQMTSADNAISNAVSIVSAAAAVVSAAVTSVNAVVSNLASDVSANSAQMTSADNAISNAVSIVSAAAAAVSADLTSVKNLVSILTSAHNALSNVVSGLGGGGASVTSAEHQSLVDRVSANSGTGGAASVTSDELSVKAPWNAAVIRIMSDLQSTAGSALVDISGLVLTVGGGETWEIDGMFMFSTSATTAGLRLGTSVPPLSLPRAFAFRRVSGGQSAGVAGGAGQMQVSGSSANMSITGIGPAGGICPVLVRAVFNVASAGTVRFMFAGIASTAASPMNIMPGSYFKAFRLK